MKNRTPLTPLEACTVMARETVSLLEGDPEALASATEFREALALFCSTQELDDGGALMAWVDAELERARRFNETGEDIPPLVDLDTPLPLPDPAMQLDAVWLLLQATARQDCTAEQWQTALNAARTLTEMDGLEDLLLTASTPAGGFLTADGLRSQLEQVQAALREQHHETGDAAPGMEQA